MSSSYLDRRQALRHISILTSLAILWRMSLMLIFSNFKPFKGSDDIFQISMITIHPFFILMVLFNLSNQNPKTSNIFNAKIICFVKVDVKSLKTFYSFLWDCFFIQLNLFVFEYTFQSMFSLLSFIHSTLKRPILTNNSNPEQSDNRETCFFQT